MLFFATLLAYFVASIRVAFCAFLVSAVTFGVFYFCGTTPLQIISSYQDFICGILFFGFFLPFIYAIFDLIFGFTADNIGHKRKDYICFDAALSSTMKWVLTIGWKVADTMGAENISIYIDNSHDIRIYSMGGINKKRIFVSLGMVEFLQKSTKVKAEVEHMLGALFAAEVANLQNYNFLPMMLIKGSDRLASILCTTATIPVRILLIPAFLIPFVRSTMIHIMNFVGYILKTVEKIFFGIIYPIYQIFGSSFDKYAENISDYQAAQLESKEMFIMVLAILKDKDYGFGFFSHSSAIARIKRVERIQQSRDFENIDPFMSCIILGCVSFSVSAIFAISAEIWLFPAFIMEHLIILHNGFVILFALLIHAKDVVKDIYHLANL